MSVRRRASGRAHYNYFRDYDPATGKYLESDPIGLQGGLNTFSYVSNSPAMRFDPLGLAECGKICGLKVKPEYSETGQIRKGKPFTWDAEFLNDATHDPRCCEVRQETLWNRPWSPEDPAYHSGFKAPENQPGKWYEDRDKNDIRYGRRDERNSSPSGSDYYSRNSDTYHGFDQPHGPPNPGFHLKFRLVVVDRCRNDKRIHVSKTLQVNF